MKRVQQAELPSTPLYRPSTPQPDNSEGTKYDIIKLLPRRENILVSINKANLYTHSDSLKLYKLVYPV